MYVFGKINVKPQLPQRIEGLYSLATNLWWSWNTYALRLYDYINSDLFSKVNKNPVKFLSEINQKRLVEVSKDEEFLKEYDIVMDNFNGYINATSTYFSKTYPDLKDTKIAYFSAEYGLDEVLPIYAGGLGILSGDHCKSASDLGIPFYPVGLLYKDGYFNQLINKDGSETFEYSKAEMDDLPILPVLNEDGTNLIISVELPGRVLYLKVWEIHIGRIKLYLLDSDIDTNSEIDRGLTLKLYGGNQETRISQEIILGIGGMKVLEALGINPTIYHMNEGHSSFVVFEVIKKIMKEKNVPFKIAREMASACTIFTTHTPVPAGNDIFPLELMDRYFAKYSADLGISRTDFLTMGSRDNYIPSTGFDMAVLALKVAGKKNGVSKLHGEVSKKLFSKLWPNTALEEIPIDYVTNGVHTCTWLAPNLKELYNAYMRPFWQERVHEKETWVDIDNVPDDELWSIHQEQKMKLIKVCRENIKAQKIRNGESIDEINETDNLLDPKALTIGFARRFATYKRADLIFKDIEKITQILNNPQRPVQIIFAGKPHPADVQGQDLVKEIYEFSKMPQFKNKVVILENYNMHVARYLVSGVDVWLNNPRRPLEASGTSGEKAGLNGVINFSILDGWWYEGFEKNKNGWAIGDDTEYTNYELQDFADSKSIYSILENEIMPLYYAKDSKGISKEWIKMMKNSIKSVGGNYNTSRMLCDYLDRLYVPQLKNILGDYSDNSKVDDFYNWKTIMQSNWNNITISSPEISNEVSIKAGDKLELTCIVNLGPIKTDFVSVEVFYGKFSKGEKLTNTSFIEMELSKELENGNYEYKTTIDIDNGGNYGYTFRVMPHHEMLINPHDMSLVKWIES
ncbi:MAG: alpha-glucan family phosphorylase [Clostridia bacterium]|nr:alpha-glucan family phosphorylase [Clostridia bacterium]